MRLVGYVRESTVSAETDSAYAQSDRIRRVANEGSHSLVALCQDVPRPGVEQSRDGYLSLLGVIDGGQVDGVIVSSLDALSPDMITQEIAIWDLRRRGVAVVTATGDEVDALAHPSTEPSRMLVREMLARFDSYHAALGQVAPPIAVSTMPQEVTIELIDPKRSSSGA